MNGLVLLMFVGAASAQVEFINEAIGNLSIRLLKKTAKIDRENTIHSAYSLISALGVCLLGSKGETFEGIKHTLGLDGVNRSDIEDGFSDTITELTPFAHRAERPKGFVINKASRIYVSQSFPISTSYQRRMINIFHTSIKQVDFTNNASGIQKDINLYVSNITRRLIPKLLDEPLPGTSSMTLINTLYFKGAWEDRMKQRKSPGRFNALPNRAGQKAEWIGTTKRLKYKASKTLKAQFVELPYISRENTRVETSMVFILPDESPDLELDTWIESEDFTWKNINAAIQTMKEEVVDLTFPKFHVESKFRLKKVLSSLGMEAAFLPKANFSVMVNGTDPSPYLDEVIHTAKIDVDENGTEAAAATAVMVMFMSLPLPFTPKVSVKIDRSFVSMIILRQGSSIVPLFTTVVNKL